VGPLQACSQAGEGHQDKKDTVPGESALGPTIRREI
jgi:hypothetical protein